MSRALSLFLSPPPTENLGNLRMWAEWVVANPDREVAAFLSRGVDGVGVIGDSFWLAYDLRPGESQTQSATCFTQAQWAQIKQAFVVAARGFLANHPAR